MIHIDELDGQLIKRDGRMLLIEVSASNDVKFIDMETGKDEGSIELLVSAYDEAERMVLAMQQSSVKGSQG